jgi:hypothetical protein
MRHPILGFGCALAFLFLGYAAAWFSDPNELEAIARNPGAVGLAFEALVLAFFFAVAVLLFVVWPQALLASWLLRRFRLHRALAFVFFFVVCSVIVCMIDFTVVDRHKWIAYFVGTGYLFIPCSILWWISFRHKPNVYIARQTPGNRESVS